MAAAPRPCWRCCRRRPPWPLAHPPACLWPGAPARPISLAAAALEPSLLMHAAAWPPGAPALTRAVTAALRPCWRCCRRRPSWPQAHPPACLWPGAPACPVSLAAAALEPSLLMHAAAWPPGAPALTRAVTAALRPCWRCCRRRPPWLQGRPPACLWPGAPARPISLAAAALEPPLHVRAAAWPPGAPALTRAVSAALHPCWRCCPRRPPWPAHLPACLLPGKHTCPVSPGAAARARRGLAPGLTRAVGTAPHPCWRCCRPLRQRLALPPPRLHPGGWSARQRAPGCVAGQETRLQAHACACAGLFGLPGATPASVQSVLHGYVHCGRSSCLASSPLQRQPPSLGGWESAVHAHHHASPGSSCCGRCCVRWAHPILMQPGPWSNDCTTLLCRPAATGSCGAGDTPDCSGRVPTAACHPPVSTRLMPHWRCSIWNLHRLHARAMGPLTSGMRWQHGLRCQMVRLVACPTHPVVHRPTGQEGFVTPTSTC